MVDTDVRLGLTGSDLAIRNRQFKKDIARFENLLAVLNVDNSPEVRALSEAGLAGEITATKRQSGQDFITVRRNRIVDVLTVMRDHADCRYDLVSDILGVDLL